MINHMFTLETLTVFTKAVKSTKNTFVTSLDILNNIIKNNNLVNFIIQRNLPDLKYKIYLVNKIGFNLKLLSLEVLQNCLQLLYYTNFITTLDIISILITENKLIHKLIIKNLQVSNLFLLTQFNKNPKLIIKNFSNKYTFKNITIGRTVEISYILNILNKTSKYNPLLLGDSGIGKFSIIRGVFFYFYFKKNSFNKNLLNFYYFDAFKLKSFITKGFFVEIKIHLMTWLYLNNIILVLNTLENIYTTSSGESFNIITIIFPLIIQKKLKIIGTLSNINYHKFITNNPIYIKYFEELNIKEPTNTDLLKILKFKSIELHKFYKIKISTTIIINTIKVACKYLKNKVFPIKGIEVLDTACSTNLSLNKLSTNNLKFAISILTKIPFEILTNKIYNEEKLKDLETLLKTFVFGQDTILRKITKSLQRALLGLKDPKKPLGSWLLCGPSGTGKTELAKALASILFGSKTELIRFDMSEFMEKHSVSKLIGSPPGYIGYGEKGLLTKALETQPYSLVLFDEIEKAHLDISNIMLQILDEGHLTDSTGNITRFNNSIIIFTSNLGCPKEEKEYDIYYKNHVKYYNLNELKVQKSISNYFKPEFLNRLDDILIFQPLNELTLILVVEKFLTQLQKYLKEQKFPVSLIINTSVKIFLSKLSSSPIYGARPLNRILNDLIATPIVDIVIKFKLKKHIFIIYTISDKDKTFKYVILPKNVLQI